MTPDPWCTATVHGTRAAHYKRGCRCTAARAAIAASNRALYHAGPSRVDATGTRRRIRALQRAGWRLVDIADRTYWPVQFVGKLATSTTILRASAERIADVYDAIGLEEGPSRRGAQVAAGKGWPSPIEWGDDIDDPDAKPLNIDRPLGTGPAAAAPWDDIVMLANTGETWERAAARLGATKSTLERRLMRTRRNDIAAQFSRNSEHYAMRENRNQWSA